MADFRLTVLVENAASRDDLTAEHGWSILIESDGELGLFDTGQTGAVLRNARALGIDLSRLSWIVLSHGHYDHTGGLRSVLEVVEGPVVFVHPDAFLPKLVRENGGEWREAGMAMSREEIERTGAAMRMCEGTERVGGRITATGGISRTTSFETVQERFFTIRNGCRVIDRFIDDQALVLDTKKGLVVIVGCCHAGVVNTLRHVREVTGTNAIHAVIGGMHLGAASEECIARTIDAFRESDVEIVGPAHCTGERAVQQFSGVLAGRCVQCPAGAVLEF